MFGAWDFPLYKPLTKVNCTLYWRSCPLYTYELISAVKLCVIICDL